jgi:hypothetical protein
MRKLFYGLIFLSISGGALAEVNCVAIPGEDYVEVKVRDTFLERTAFIKQLHPETSRPVVDEVGVRTKDKTKIVSFMNEEKDFSLHIDKRVTDRRQIPVYRGVLSFGEILTELDCFVE